MNTARYLAAALAAAGVAIVVAGPLWAVVDSDIGRTDGNIGPGDGIAAVPAAFVAGRGGADE